MGDGPGPEGLGGAGSGDDASPAPPALPAPGGQVPGPPARGRSRSLIIGLVAAAVAVVALVVGIVLATSGTKDPFSAGDGNATITWTSVGGTGNPPQPFGGVIDGLPVSGVATADLAAIEGAGASALTAAPARIRIFEFKGTFDGKGFALGIYVQYQHPPSATQPPAFPTIQVSGSYGQESVRATITPPASILSNPESIDRSTPIPFDGTIGNLEVSGSFTAPTKQGEQNSAGAKFTVK